MSDLLWQKPGVAVDARIMQFLAGDDVLLDREFFAHDIAAQAWPRAAPACHRRELRVHGHTGAVIRHQLALARDRHDRIRADRATRRGDGVGAGRGVRHGLGGLLSRGMAGPPL